MTSWDKGSSLPSATLCSNVSDCLPVVLKGPTPSLGLLEKKLSMGFEPDAACTRKYFKLKRHQRPLAWPCYETHKFING